MENETLAMEILRELKKSGQRKFVIIIILIMALVGTNIYWIKKQSENEYEIITEETTVDTEGEGMATYLENSESGDIINGENN